MKSLVIINGSAGEGKAKAEFDKIKSAFSGLDVEFHATTEPKDATTFVDSYLRKHSSETVRVYACGGDGTVNEVVNGLVGHKNAELAIYPIGTGNDFVKMYGGKEKFLDIASLIDASAKSVDLSKLTGGELKKPFYSINVINFGFDAIVGSVGNKYKEQGKKDPYGKALKVAILKGRFNKINVTADGEKISKKKMLLCTLAQGQYVGGKFFCAPKSDNTDGLIDVCLLHTMSLFGFLGILNPYTAGQHLDGKFDKKLAYRRAKEIVIESDKDIDICVDGEMVKGTKFTVTSCPKAIRLVIPE